MSGFEAWIGNCHLREIEGDGEYHCQAAVWADSYDSFRTRLAQHIESSGLQILWLEETLSASQYLHRHGNPHKIGGLSRAVHPHHLVELGPLTLKGSTEENASAKALSLPETLLALDCKAAPAFAVLDGAQFDNLPKALFDGDFVSRPLYLDRGENDPEQIITAPHMVWIDERAEKVTGRPPAETIPALFDLIEDKPAAVFWQCSDGGDVLYKHLRKINKIMIPKSELPGGIIGDEDDETHAMVIFRHADANVLVQTLYAMTTLEASHFYGPASSLLFSPDLNWSEGENWIRVDRSENWPKPKPGMLRLCQETIGGIYGKRKNMSDVLSKNDEHRLFSFIMDLDLFKNSDEKDVRIAVRLAIKYRDHVGIKSPNGLAWAIIINYLSIRHARFKKIRRKIFNLKGWSFDQFARILQLKAREK